MEAFQKFHFTGRHFLDDAEQADFYWQKA